MSGRCVQGLELKTLRGEFTGLAESVYPRMRLIATQRWQINYLIVGLQLSSSLVIFPGTSDNKGGLLLVIGQDQKFLEVSDGLTAPISHITQPNSIAGPPAIIIPTAKVTSLSFGAYGIPVLANSPVSLYAFADATAGNDIFAILSLQVLQFEKSGRS